MRRLLLAALAAFPLFAFGAASYTPEVSVTVPPGTSVKTTRRTTNSSKDVLITVNKGSKLTITEAQPAPPVVVPPVVTPPAGSSDFDARKAAPGVVRWFDFDSDAQLGLYYNNSGYQVGDFGFLHSSTDHVTHATIDTSTKASGAGSMMFPIRAASDADSAGSFYTRFPLVPDGGSVFVQVRVKWSKEVAQQFYRADGSGGIKFFDIAAGDDGGITQWSSADLKVVVQTLEHSLIPITYSYDGFGNNQGMFSDKLENGLDCTLAKMAPLATAANTSRAPYSVPGCFEMVADEWVTFMLGVNVGARVQRTTGPTAGQAGYYEYANSRVRLWAAREGKAPVLLNDWNVSSPGYFGLNASNAIDPNLGTLTGPQLRFGKVWLFPYQTGRYDYVTYQPGRVWYDELIIGTKPIPFPGGFTVTDDAVGQVVKPTPPPVVTPPDPPPVVTPPPGPTADGVTLTNLGRYTCTQNDGICELVTDYSGLVYDAKRRQMVIFGGGHASTNYDGVNAFQLDAGKWREEYPPTPQASMIPSNYDRSRGMWLAGPSGPYPRATARHTDRLLVVVGDELHILTGVEGNGIGLGAGWPQPIGTYELGTPDGTPHLAYNLATKTWRVGPAASKVVNGWEAAALDPVSGKVVLVGQTGIHVYDPATMVRTLVFDATNFPDVSRLFYEPTGQVESDNKMHPNGSLVYFPPQDVFIYINPDNGRTFRVTLDRANYHNSKVERFGVELDLLRESGWAYDPDKKLIVGGLWHGTLRTFDPVAKKWATLNVGQDVGVAFFAWDYDPVGKRHIFIGADRNTYALKLN
jgi:hypothetical protein